MSRGNRARRRLVFGSACLLLVALGACLSFGDLSGGVPVSGAEASTDSPTTPPPNDAATPDAAPCLVDASSPYLIDAIQVSAGSTHACAIRQDGSVVCWGSNNYGQLGVDLSIPKTAKPLALSLPAAAGRAVQIAAGFISTCMLDSNAAVWCWGDSSFGERGNGVVDASFSSAIVRVVDRNGKPLAATQIATGYELACAVTSGGVVQCWGSNGAGILGDASVGTTAAVATPVGGLRALAAGGTIATLGSAQSMCMADSIGVACWGRSGSGELGNGGGGGGYPFGAIYTGIPTAISAVEGAPPLSSITVGLGHGCAIDTHDGLYCWGYNDRGEVGPTNLGGPVGIPPQFVDAGHVIEVAAGASHNCAITTGTSAVCFGDNSTAALGRGAPYDGGTVPAPVLDLDGGGALSQVIELSGGAGFTCARVASTACGESGPGSVVCWGSNTAGQLGFVSGAIAPSPQHVQSP